jgi:hypothetical protein
MRHIFETSNIFCIKKNVQNMLGYWPYATHKKTFLIYMYICHIASKTGYSKYEIDIFYNIKKIQTLNKYARKS